MTIMQSHQLVVEKFTGDGVSADMITSAANLFSSHYGIWGPETSQAGRRVRMSPNTLRAQVFPEASQSQCLYVRARGPNDELTGNAFACTWEFAVGEKKITVCWITQLVVAAGYRNRRIATRMLESLKDDSFDTYGIASSQPFAVMAACRAFGRGIERASVNIAREYSVACLMKAPIPYLAHAGFIDGGTNLTIDTRFYVDHTEPKKALEILRQPKAGDPVGRRWPLGRLPSGHEYLMMIGVHPAVRHQSDHRYEFLC